MAKRPKTRKGVVEDKKRDRESSLTCGAAWNQCGERKQCQEPFRGAWRDYLFTFPLNLPKSDKLGE